MFTIAGYVSRKLKGKKVELPIGVSDIKIGESGDVSILFLYPTPEQNISDFTVLYDYQVSKTKESPPSYDVKRKNSILFTIDGYNKISVYPRKKFSFRNFLMRKVDVVNERVLYSVDALRRANLSVSDYLQELRFCLLNKHIPMWFVNDQESYLVGQTNSVGDQGLIMDLFEGFPNIRIDYNSDINQFQIRYRNRVQQETGVYIYKKGILVDGFEQVCKNENGKPVFETHYFSENSLFVSLFTPLKSIEGQPKIIEQPSINVGKPEEDLKRIKEMLHFESVTPTRDKGLKEDFKRIKKMLKEN
jgi:hypothetical protein